jgi:hypothetical protein
MSVEQEFTDAPQASPAEAEARIFGWKPLEEFNGPPERWRNAESFLEKGRQINGFLRKDFEKLRTELSVRDQRIAALELNIREFAEYHRETEARAYERAIANLKEERKAALRESDGERVVQIEEQLDDLQAAAKTKLAPRAPAPRDPNTPDPAFVAWVENNSWYKENRVLRSLTHDYAEELKQKEPNLLGTAFLDKVKEIVQDNHPELFQNPERTRPGTVTGGSDTRTPRAGRSKTYADMPVEARIACDKFVKKGFLTKEAYVKDYFGDEAA